MISLSTQLAAQFIRRCIYRFLGAFDRATRRKSYIVILCYHGFSNDQWRFNTSPEIFEKHLHILKNLGYTFCTYKQVIDHISGRAVLSNPSVLLSIDDGYESVRSIVPLMQKYNISPVLSILSDTARANRKEMENNLKFLSDPELTSLVSLGWEIGSHSATHPNLTKSSEDQLKSEITDSKRSLESVLGAQVTVFTYPKGAYTSKIIHTVKSAGYTSALSMDDGTIDSKTPLYSIPRVGVDQSHTLIEFPNLFSPSVIKFRQVIKNSVLVKLL